MAQAGICHSTIFSRYIKKETAPDIFFHRPAHFIYSNPASTSFSKHALTLYRYFDHTISLIFKKFICFFDSAKRIGMCDKCFCINLTFCDQFQGFLTITSIHSTCFECEIFSIHIRARTSPTSKACLSVTPSGILFSPWSANGTLTYSA